MNRRICMELGIVLGIVLLFSIIIPSTVAAMRQTDREKQVVSVRIEEGDSLWSIATTYMSTEYKSVNRYIKEIKKANHLDSDTIHEGCYLIIPVYVDAE